MMNYFTLLVSIYKNNNVIEIIKLIKSINSQSLYPGEVLFIYDGPIKIEVDNYIKKIKNIKIIKNYKNLGLGNSLKKGVLSAKYPIIIRCDVDDINLNSRFKILYKTFLNNQKFDVIGSLQEEIYYDVKFIKKIPYKNSEIKKNLTFRNCINHPTVLLKKKTIIKSGNYENVGKYLNCNNFEDYYLWLKMRKINARFINIQKTLIKSQINKKFFERRVGENMIINYKMFLRKCYKNKLLSKYSIFVNYFIRTLIYKMPTKYFINFARIFLRLKIN